MDYFYVIFKLIDGSIVNGQKIHLDHKDWKYQKILNKKYQKGKKNLDIYNFAPCVTRYALAVNYWYYW
jgi:hypothetical protein